VLTLRNLQPEGFVAGSSLRAAVLDAFNIFVKMFRQHPGSLRENPENGCSIEPAFHVMPERPISNFLAQLVQTLRMAILFNPNLETAFDLNEKVVGEAFQDLQLQLHHTPGFRFDLCRYEEVVPEPESLRFDIS
jgi:hypothetical protein